MQYVVGGEAAVRIERAAGAEHDLTGGDEEDTSSGEDGEPYDPQAVTVPVTLCLAIMVG